MTIRYYYLVMSQIDMLENQVLEEILRERANYYLSKNKNIDFWLLNKFFFDSKKKSGLGIRSFAHFAHRSFAHFAQIK